MDKLIITAAITGAVHVPSMSEFLPITKEDIINEAIAAYNAGASVVHLHTRDEKTGKPSSNPEDMKEIVERIREKCDVVIGITTGGAIGMSNKERLAAIPLSNAELASCNSGSVNFCFSGISDIIENPKHEWEIPFVENTYKVPFVNTFQDIEDYINIMNKYGTKPEFEVYEVGMLNNIKYFYEKGLLKGPIYIQFILGVLGGIPATVENLLFLYKTAKEMFGKDLVWSCAAAGKQQFDIVTMAILLGGNVRVGLEDNLYLKKGRLAKSNSESVSKIKKIGELLDREIATAEEAREILF